MSREVPLATPGEIHLLKTRIYNAKERFDSPACRCVS